MREKSRMRASPSWTEAFYVGKATSVEGNEEGIVVELGHTWEGLIGAGRDRNGEVGREAGNLFFFFL